MTDHTQRQVFQSERTNIANATLVDVAIEPLQAGEVLVAIDAFALTANNITYGVAGDTIGYWQFFPAHDPDGIGFGCIPVWGFAEVVASLHDDVPVGERLYGYFPMASHVTLTPEHVTEHALVDGASHRAALPVVYNQYTRCATDPAYSPELEAEQMLYRPLFTTSFFIDDFLLDNTFFGADRVLLTSASSKTSLGLAQLLFANRDCQVVGLTSAGNRSFVESLGCYHEVLAYEDVQALPLEPTVLVDMAGNGALRASVHSHLGDHLKYSCAVGATHWEAASVGGTQTELAGPQPQMFFAPSQIQKRLKEWGREEYNARMSGAWGAFLRSAEGWVSVNRGRGGDALAATYQAFIDGRADPSLGYVMSLDASAD